jgi:penicillin amidase
MTRRFALTLLFVLVLPSLSCSRPETLVENEARLREQSRARLAQIEGTLPLDGLQQPVEVLRDTWGVAHIYARSAQDLFLAQGFTAAQDRLYQIEIWRRTGAGELAEVFGPEFVERDRIARLVRYRGDLKKEWESYSPDAESIAQAFTAGVNAFIRQAGDRLPIEFELLDFRPGEWKPEHCLLRIAGLMMTRNASQEVARAEMVAKLGSEVTARYFPADPVRKLDPDPDVDLAGIDEAVLAGYRSAISIPSLAGNEGSNNWVVDGTLSATGKPLLASDPHRAVVLPSLRYMVHLVGPGWNVIGSGEPALPGVAIGHNEHAGWGFTIVQYDQVDLYVEKTDPANANRYLYNGEWLDMQVEREQIKVKSAEPVEVELKFTRHGPVIWEDKASNRAIALRWAGAEPGTAGYLASLAVDRVSNWQQFTEAMARWKLPSENIIYGDVSGNIGWIPAGLMPIRENWSGLFPVPGHTGKYEWNGFRTVGQLPQRHNPAEHYIATANHNIRPKNYSYDLAFDWADPYRFRRIDEVLRSKKNFTIEDFQRLQHDQTSHPARELIAMAKQLPAQASPAAKEAHQLLADWDNVLDKDSAAAAVFEVWLRQIRPAFAERQVAVEARELVLKNLTLERTITLLKELPAADRQAVLAHSLEAAVAEGQNLLGGDTSRWRWGTLHTITFRHPLANTPARQTVFSLGPIERGGDGYVPNATSGAGYSQASGASYRHILDMADWDRSVFTSTPGQSGQPGSPHYGDLLPLWANHQYAPLVFSREAVEKNTAHKLLLEPK